MSQSNQPPILEREVASSHLVIAPGFQVQPKTVSVHDVEEVSCQVNQLFQKHPDFFEPDTQGFCGADLSKILDRLPAPLQKKFTHEGCFANGLRVFIYPKHHNMEWPPLSFMLREKLRSLVDAYHTLHPNEQLDEEALIQSLLNQVPCKKHDLKHAQESFETVTAACLKELHRKAGTFKNLQEFSKKLIKKSTKMANPTDILTINLDSNHFSYTQGSLVTANDAEIQSGTRNLGLAVGGELTPQDAKAVSFYFKHGSLAPADAFKRRKWGEWVYCFFQQKSANQDILNATLENAKTVLKSMLCFKIANGELFSAECLNVVDWNYQLLTSNFLDQEYQAESYAYIVKALGELDGFRCDIPAQSGEPLQFEVRTSVFNAGINKIASFEYDKKDTQRIQNRKAYVHLSVVGRKFHAEDEPREDELLDQLYGEYDSLNTEISLKKEEKMVDELLLLDWEKRRNDLIEKIEHMEQTNWERRSERRVLCLNALQEKIEGHGTVQKKEQAWIQLLKIYMDDLYYTTQYKEPDKAFLFNMYSSAFQQLTGMLLDMGCKSANDRTYVQRLGNDHLMECIRSGEFLQPLHLDPVALQAFLESLGADAMTHSALHACIQDTGGGAPKVDADKFPFLVSIARVLKYLNKFGDWAANSMMKFKGPIFQRAIQEDPCSVGEQDRST